MELHGTFESLLAYLRQVEGCHGPHQACKERLLRQHGRAFEPATLMTDEMSLLESRAALLGTAIDGFERKQCFSNSQQLVTSGPDGSLVYCEGYCYPKGGLPIHHAWLTLNGKVVDVTLRHRGTGEAIFGLFADRHYFGVAFSTPLVRTEMLRTMLTGPLLEDAINLDVADGVVTRIERYHDG